MAAEAKSSHTTAGEFSTERALSLTQSCVYSDGLVSLPVYIAGIEELYKLLTTKFVGQNLDFLLSGMNTKLTILQELCRGPDSQHYTTVQGMVSFEEEQNFIEREDKPSGTQTLLRIHRLLEFVCAGLEKFNDLSLSEEVLTDEIFRVYTETLGRFHPQLMVASIQCTLPLVVPSRMVFMAEIGLDVAANDKKLLEEAMLWMVQMTSSMRKLCEAVQKVYADHELLNLSQGSL